MQQGSLLVVGAGIMLAGQCTFEARNAIIEADIVFGLMGGPHHQQWLEALNSNVRPLDGFYARADTRPLAYGAMAEEIVAAVRTGAKVCAVFYGHPGSFVTPSHEAIRRARAEGYEADMLPGISADACLIADLGVDPGRFGWQSFEARDFLLNARVHDPAAALILWQIAILSDDELSRLEPDHRGLSALAAVLMQTYPPDHQVTVYEARSLPTSAPLIEAVPLHALDRAPLSQASTLYVPPAFVARPAKARIELLHAYLSDDAPVL